MPKPVAVEGDTHFRTSPKQLVEDKDKRGKWVLQSSSITLGQTLGVDGKPVVLSASADWSYEGGKANNAAIEPIPDSATLTASPTILTDSGSFLLVDGDEATGSMDSGNRIVVKASQAILSTD